MDGGKCVGAIVCKLDMHKKMVRRGYIAMLAVDSDYRRRKIRQMSLPICSTVQLYIATHARE
jgi:ribosomal protein S18 acetylase RimI-like enzyme